MVWAPTIDSTGQELAKVYPLVIQYTRGKGLDIGSGSARWFAHWITLDSGKDYGKQRVADLAMDGGGPIPFQDGALDFVISSHFIEHVKEWPKAIAEWWRIIKPGGYLTLYWPHPDFYPKVGEKGANPDHKADIYPHDMVRVMRKLGGWDLVENETRIQKDEYSQFQVWRKRTDSQQNVIPWTKPDRKSVLVIRYGAFGDLIQASSVIAGLKADGYHVTLNTTPKGHGVVYNDPNIDAFVLQDEDQVPNQSLGPYWEELGKRYDRVVNLCSSVEDVMLTMPHSLHDKHSHGARHKLFNQNYLERQHDIADLPHDFRPAFYPVQTEVDFVTKIIKEVEGPRLLWIMAGSSVNKLWPHMAPAIVRLLREFEGTIILAGEEKHQEIELAIQNSCKMFLGDASRIVRTAGLWPIRGTMTLAQHVDVVIGPETGVLNAVSHLDIPKVVFLSHSSEENLTKHWKNVFPLMPVKGSTPCYPCHRMIYNFTDGRCVKHEETGTALCQFNTTIEDAVKAIKQAIEASRLLKSEETPAPEAIAAQVQEVADAMAAAAE